MPLLLGYFSVCLGYAYRVGLSKQVSDCNYIKVNRLVICLQVDFILGFKYVRIGKISYY